MLQSILIQLSELSVNQEKLAAKVDALAGTSASLTSPPTSPPQRPQDTLLSASLGGAAPIGIAESSARPSLSDADGFSSSRANFLEWARSHSSTPAAGVDGAPGSSPSVPAPKVAPESPYPQRVILTSAPRSLSPGLSLFIVIGHVLTPDLPLPFIGCLQPILVKSASTLCLSTGARLRPWNVVLWSPPATQALSSSATPLVPITAPTLSVRIISYPLVLL